MTVTDQGFSGTCKMFSCYKLTAESEICNTMFVGVYLMVTCCRVIQINHLLNILSLSNGYILLVDIPACNQI